MVYLHHVITVDSYAAQHTCLDLVPKSISPCFGITATQPGTWHPQKETNLINCKVSKTLSRGPVVYKAICGRLGIETIQPIGALKLLSSPKRKHFLKCLQMAKIIGRYNGATVMCQAFNISKSDCRFNNMVSHFDPPSQSLWVKDSDRCWWRPSWSMPPCNVW